MRIPALFDKIGGAHLIPAAGGGDGHEIENQIELPQKRPPLSILPGKLRYQACNNTMCFPPKTVDVKLPVEVQ